MDIESENSDPQQSDVRHQLHCDQAMFHQTQMETNPTGTIRESNCGLSNIMPMELPVQTAIPLPAPPSLPTPMLPPNASQQISTEVDIDSVLLQQFSCLGTTDHEDLICQFQSLMNLKDMNRDSAIFFLEMSNWNLQTAVGCYLDICNFQNWPSMKIVEKTSPNEHSHCWRLLNDGTEDWPSGCYLMCLNQRERIDMPVVRPGNTCVITANLLPNQPVIMWKLCTPNGSFFGDTVWMIPPGTSDNAEDLAERMSLLRTPSNMLSPEIFRQLNIMITVNME